MKNTRNLFLKFFCPSIYISQFVASSTIVHCTAILHILLYLRGTVFQSLLLSSTTSLELRALSNANYGSDPTNFLEE